MKGKSHVMSRLLLLLIVLATISSCLVTAHAEGGFHTEGDQAFDSGGGTSTSTGDYSLAYTDNVAKQIVGYRFTGITAAGEKVSAGKDVYLTNAQLVLDKGQSGFNSMFTATKGENAIYMYKWRYCKKEYSDAELANTSLGNITTTAKTNYLYEWNISGLSGGNIPRTWDELKEWQKLGNNDEWLAKLVGYSSKSAMKPGDKIIVEPIFYILELEGDKVFMTVSEIASYGQSRFGGTSDGWTGVPNVNDSPNGDGADTFGFLANYTNRKWPNAFFTEDGMGLWGDATAIPASGSKKRAIFNDILKNGYGVCILYTNEQKLPDLYVESIKFYTSDGQEQNPGALPLNKHIYVFATFKASVDKSVLANFFGYDNKNDRSGRDVAASSMNVVTTMYPTSTFNYTKYDKATMIPYASSTASTRYEAYMANSSKYEVCIGTMSASSAISGYFHARVYLNDKTSATLSDETNTSNNYKKISYTFASTLERDVEITDITFKVNGTKVTDLKSIPFGATVDVYHTYRSNSKADGSSISEPYCLFLYGTSSTTSNLSKFVMDGSMYHEASSLSTTKHVTSFIATSFNEVTRYGAIYLKGDDSYSASGETNKSNNKKSITWAAKCDVQLYQIILKDANGNELGRYTRGATNNVTPTLQQGQSVKVYYVYKNTSGRNIVVNGHSSSSATTGNITASQVNIPANGTLTDYGYTFTVPSNVSSGKVSGSVYVDKPSYNISSTSVTYTGCETNSSNNTLSMNYDIQTAKDVAITMIQYVYINANGGNVTQTVTAGGTNVPVFPRGATVYVWLTFKNNTGEAVKIDGYYKHNGTSGLSLMSSTNSDYNANGIDLAAYGTATKCAGYFVANDLGQKYYYGAVYLDGKTDTTGDSNPSNNTMKASYKVYGDVGIEIYFTDKNNNIVDPAVFWQGAEYKVWLKVTNYTPFAQNVGVYYNGEIVGYDLNDNGAIDTTILNLGASGNTHAIYSFVVDTLTGSELEKALGHYSVKAEVYFYGSTTATGECDVNGNDKTANNTATKNYTIIAEVGITNIIYKDEDGNILNTSGILEGTKVKVYFVCTNDATVDIAVELLYNGENFADGTILPAKTTGTEIYITEFIAEDPSQTHKDIGEVYRLVSGISQPADGEENEDNNIKLSFYNVIFYDVAITDIFYQDADGNFYGRGNNDDVSLVVGKPYKVYYTLKNFSDEVVLTHVYTQKDPFATGATRITGRILRTPDGTTIDARNGLELSEFESISVHVGTILAANQEIGTGAVGGYIYICDAGFGYNDVPNTDIERNAANNALGEKIIFKHNVSIEEVYLTPLGSNQRFPVNSSDPSFVDIPVGTTANVHYVLKNHTGKTIKVNIYAGSTPKMQTVNHGNYVITLNPMETKEVVLDKTLTLNATGRRMLVGSVYRDGYSPNTDPYEMTFSDNTTNCYYNGVVTPYITPIKPNAPYREGTDVITSYYLFNPTNKAYNGHPGATAEVRLTVKLKGTTKVIYEENKFTVIPASCSTVDRAQLVYFKWSVPEDYLKDTDKFEVCADLVIPQYPDIGISYVSYSQDYINKDARFTPDTKYEASEPDGWTKPSSPDVSYSETKEWYTWTYNNGTFTRNRYGIEANGGYTGIMPTSVTAFNQRGQYYMKSGYGVEIGYSTGYYMNYPSTPGGSYSTLLADMYTVPQYAYMIWPEFQYSEEDGCISTLEWVASAPEGDRWKLYEFMDYGRVHWTPIWFPDGDYIAYACYSDLWTPMGMITVCSQSNKIIIDGNMYDDWYIGHG